MGKRYCTCMLVGDRPYLSLQTHRKPHSQSAESRWAFVHTLHSRPAWAATWWTWTWHLERQTWPAAVHRKLQHQVKEITLLRSMPAALSLVTWSDPAEPLFPGRWTVVRCWQVLVRVPNTSLKDTTVSWGNLEDFQSLKAAHYPWNLEIRGTVYWQTPHTVNGVWERRETRGRGPTHS